MSLFVGEDDTIVSIMASYNYGPDVALALADCSYSSDDEPVATVAVGVVTGVSDGSATITVSYTEGIITETDTVDVTVSPVPPKLELTPASQSVLVGNQGTINIVVEDVTNLLSGDITLSFDDSKLTYISSALGSFFSDGFKSALATGGSLNIAFATTDVVKPSGTGTVLTVTFERIDSGVTDICFDTTVLTNQDGIDFPHTKGGCVSFN